MNLVNKFLENSIKENILYVSAFMSSLYLTKSIFDFFRNIRHQKNRNIDIKRITDLERNNLNLDNGNLNKEQIIYLYYKILFSIYSKEYDEYNILRRKIFKEENFSKYVNFVKNFEIYDENILKIIYREFEIDENTLDFTIQDKALVR